ncbi:hypothetical protein E6P97_02120 [Patescibacteria group bacterium]|nr:MAG: hypothetical protein E6P97_02120 [Patescibacteria group bacterium]
MANAKKTRAKQPKKVRDDRPVKLSVGVFEHTSRSCMFFWRNRMLFVRYLFVMWLIFMLVVGASQQTQYLSNRDSAEAYGLSVAKGGERIIIEFGVIAVAIATGGNNAGFSETQRIVVWLLYIGFVLIALWLMRNRAAGKPVSIRDGFYNAMTPLIPFTMIIAIGLLQLLPLAVASVIYATAVSTLQGGAWFWIVLALIITAGVATFYWMISTLFALIISTLPGTYPLAALRSARGLVVGLRSMIIVRLMWLALVALISLGLGIVLVIVIDSIGGSVLVASLVQLMVLTIVLYCIGYIYLLYREIIDARE